MKTIVLCDSAEALRYGLVDPDAPNESELEAMTVRALGSIYRGHQCVIFGGGFRYDERVYRPDLALVARDYSHWFVIEVELVSHSFDRHVLPQVVGFQYGTPEPDCAQVLSRGLRISEGEARTLVELVPRTVAVVANKRDSRWEIALGAHGVQLVAVSRFRSDKGAEALELDGSLEVFRESLGFGTYSATDRSLRLRRDVRLPAGVVQISDPSGATSSWTVTRGGEATWVTKDVGTPDIDDATYVQLLRTVEGTISIRKARATS